MRIQTAFDIIILVISCEALVQLWRTAGPLQGIREWIVNHSPFLYSERQQSHLFDCAYCLSWWVAMGLVVGYVFFHSATMILAYGLSIHRLSNYLHLAFSFVRDVQIDKRVARNADRKNIH